MKKNVGQIDRVLRILFGLFLIWFGLFPLHGLEGDVLGIAVAVFSVVPFVISASRVCPVFSMLKISSITKKEEQKAS